LSGLAQHVVEHDDAPVLPESHLANGAAFAVAAVHGDRWSVAAAGRGDAHHVEVQESAPLTLPAQARGFHGGSGSVDVTWRASEPLTLVASAGRSWRPPALDELYAHGPAPGRERWVIGTRDLHAEAGLGIEAGADWSRGTTRATLRGFHRRIEGYVTLDPTTELRDGLPVHRYTAHDAAFTGAEASASLSPLDGLFVSGRLDYVSAEDRDTSSPLASIPPPRWSIALERRQATRWDEARAAFGAELRGAGRSTRVGPGDVPTEPYTLLDLRGALLWTHEQSSVAIELRIANVADTAYREFLAAGDGVGQGEGRSFELRLSAIR
jgi:outer membrane receptor protein involved in Fe transport